MMHGWLRAYQKRAIVALMVRWNGGVPPRRGKRHPSELLDGKRTVVFSSDLILWI
jgi:hypothetical protein